MASSTSMRCTWERDLEWYIREAQYERRQRRRQARAEAPCTAEAQCEKRQQKCYDNSRFRRPYIFPATEPEPFVFRTLVELVNDFTQRQRTRAAAKEELGRTILQNETSALGDPQEVSWLKTERNQSKSMPTAPPQPELAPLQNDAPALGEPQEVSRRQRKVN